MLIIRKIARSDVKKIDRIIRSAVIAIADYGNACWINTKTEAPNGADKRQRSFAIAIRRRSNARQRLKQCYRGEFDEVELA